MAENIRVFARESCHTPTIERLRDIATELGLDIAKDELLEYSDCLKNWLKDCTLLDQLSEPIPPVKYPRTTGYQPALEENSHNAWYYKTTIRGCETGILAGKTIALKDNVALAGVPMMVGSRLMEGYIPEFDATIVTRILDAGGEIVGKATCEDMCRSGSSFTAANGPVRNPVDRSRSAGGSSSGCAALLALEEVDMAVGGDQGGSIRIPASWCGVVGLKPTFGLVPYTGIGAFEMSIDHVGPMAKNVTDCARLLQVMVGYDDGLDPRQRTDVPVSNYLDQLTGDVSNIRVGLVEEGFSCCDVAVQEVVRASVAKYLPQTIIKDTSIPIHITAPAIWAPSCRQGVYNTMFQHHGVGTGYRGFYHTSMSEYMFRGLRTRQNDISPTLKLTCLYGEVLNRQYGSKYYCKSMNLSRLITAAYDEALSVHDVLVMPTMLTTAHKLPTPDLSIKGYLDQALGQGRNTSVFNATGHPALSVNAGYLEGLPVGVMIVGKHLDEATVLNVGLALEKARDDASHANLSTLPDKRS